MNFLYLFNIIIMHHWIVILGNYLPAVGRVVVAVVGGATVGGVVPVVGKTTGG